VSSGESSQSHSTSRGKMSFCRGHLFEVGGARLEKYSVVFALMFAASTSPASRWRAKRVSVLIITNSSFYLKGRQRKGGRVEFRSSRGNCRRLRHSLRRSDDLFSLVSGCTPSGTGVFGQGYWRRGRGELACLVGKAEAGWILLGYQPPGLGCKENGSYDGSRGFSLKETARVFERRAQSLVVIRHIG